MNENLLSSYAVFKVLSEKNKNVYDVLKCFIAAYIGEEQKYQRFSVVEFSKRFNGYFGFSIPNSVIKNVLISMEKVCVKNGFFQIKKECIDSIEPVNIEFYKMETNLVLNEFVDFVQKKKAESLSYSEKEKLKGIFINYFAGNVKDEQMLKEISTFIITVEDEELKEILNNIELGSLIYKGITSDLIPEENKNLMQSSLWKNDLTVYFNTDILFDIYGYNGDLYKIFSNELIALIKEINLKKEYIHMRYFYCTKREIDNYFSAAKTF